MAEFIFSAFADEAGDSVEEQIAALRENGIHLIEPRFFDKRGVLDLTEEELTEVRRKLDAGGITVGSLGSPVGKYTIDGDFDEYMNTTFRRALRAAEILGTKRMRIFSFFVPQDTLAAHRDEVMRRMKKMVKVAAECGIMLCHENESAIYGQMPGEVRELLTEVPGLYGIFDPANYIMNGANPYEGIGATLIRPGYLHIKDAIYKTQTIVPAGEGEGAIGDIIDTVNGHTDGRVMLTLEPHLALFAAFKSIDAHTELRGNRVFNNNREAFDFAVRSLEALMTSRGYRKDGNGIWKK